MMTGDLSTYFTETWFGGGYIQVPIFIYGFFNQVVIELHKYICMVKDKETINHRSRFQVIQETASLLIKSLVDRLSLIMK